MLFARYWTHTELFGAERPIEVLSIQLARFDPVRLLLTTSVLGIVLQLWKRQGADPRIYSALVRGMFPEQVAVRILQDHTRFLFSRRQLLIAMRYAIENLAEDAAVEGHPPRDDAFWGNLGVLLLSINEQLHYGLAGRDTAEAKRVRRLFTEIVPVVEDAGTAMLSTIGRAAVMVNELAPNRRESPHYIDIPAVFEHQTRCPLALFQATCLGLITHWTRLDFAGLVQNPAAVYLHHDWFRTVAADLEGVTRCVNLLASDFNTLKRRFRQLRKEDLTPFRASPLIRIGDRYVLSDAIFLAEAFQAFPFWTINRAVDATRFRQFWGELFEVYLSDMTSHLSAPHVNNVILNPRFEDGGQVCDLILHYRDSAVLVEAKAAMFSAEAKYSGSAASLFRAFHEKFVRNEAGDERGVRQLARSIEGICVDARNVPGVRFHEISEIFPVLITLDQIGDNLLFNKALNLYFDSHALTRRCQKKVWPVVGMAAESYEFFVSPASQVPASVLLRDWLVHDSRLLWNYAARRTEISSLLQCIRNDYLNQKFRAVMQQTIRQFFPAQEAALVE